MPTTTGCITNYAEQKILDHLLNNTSWTMPVCYLGLLIATPTDTGGTEVTTAGTQGYARIAVGTGGASIFGASASGTTTSVSTVTWGPALAAWSAVSYWGLYDAATAGNLLAYGDTTDGTIATDDSYRIVSGSLSLTWGLTKWVTAVNNSVLDHLTGRAAYTSPATWIALFSGDPLAAGTEITTAGTNGYARQDLDAALSAATSGSITNSIIISFGPASSNWGTTDYYAVFDAVTAGTKMGGAALTASKTINSGDTAEFAAAALTITLD